MLEAVQSAQGATVIVAFFVLLFLAFGLTCIIDGAISLAEQRAKEGWSNKIRWW